MKSGPRPIRAAQLVGATAGSAASTVWLAFLGVLTTPYILHRLGAAAYGVFALITILSAYLANLELGFGHALVRFVSRARGMADEVEVRHVLSTSLAVFLAAGATAAGVAFVGAPFVVRQFANVPPALEGEALSALRLGALILLLTLVSTFSTSALIGLGRFSIVVGLRAMAGTLAAAAAVVTVALGGGLVAVLAAQVGVSLLNCAVLAATLIVTQDRWLPPRIHRPTFVAMARFSGFVFAAGLAYQVMLLGPPTVLAGHVTTAELVTYTIPALVLQQLIVLVTSASLGFLPLASAASADADRSRLAAIFRSHLRLTLLVMGPIVAYLAVFAEPLLAAWIDPDFAAAADDPMRFLAGGALMIALSAPPADVARGLGRPGWVVWFTLAAAALEVTFALAFVTSHGATGVSIALCLGLVIATLPLVWIVGRRLLGHRARELIGALALPGLAVLAATSFYVLGAVVSSGFTGAVVTGVVATALYAAIVYRRILEEPERRAFRRQGSAA